jgi:hypothetical protein
MAAPIFDTDVVSCFLKPNDPRAPLYLPHLQSSVPIISFQTLAELLRWAIEHHWGAPRRAALDQFLQQFGIQFPDRALC